MAYSNIDSLNLGKVLQIAFTNGVRLQISNDFRDFEMVKRARVGNTLARELRFMFQTSLGPAAIQYANPGTSGRAFPSAQQASVSEYTAKFKEINATIELEYNLWKRAQKSPEKYAEPLAIEIDSKASAAKRQIAKDLYGDGTGVIGTCSATNAVTSPASDKIVFTLSDSDSARGHVGFFEPDDILVLKASDGTASAFNSSLATEPVYWKVYDKDRDAGTVTLQGLNSSLASAGTISSITTPTTAGDVFYRLQATIPDLSSVSDYGTVSEVMAGLDSLAAWDGRTVHGITMSGATGGSHYDVGGSAIDVVHIERLMNQMKLRVGQDRYRWKMLSSAPETQSAFIESRETDRRFQSVEDNKRGVKVFAYIHRQDTLEFVDTEYCPQNRIYALPESKAGEKVIEFHGTDFEAVRPQGGNEWNLKPSSSGGFVNTMVSYLQSCGVMICKHPAAVGVLHNFTN